MRTDNVQITRTRQSDGTYIINYHSRSNYDIEKDAVNRGIAMLNRRGPNNKDGFNIAFGVAKSFGAKETPREKGPVRTVADNPVQKRSSRREAALAKKYTPGQDSYKFGSDEDFKAYAVAHREQFAIHKYPDGKVEYRELGTGRMLKGKEHEQAMNKVLAEAGEVYTIKNRGELVDVAKRTGIDINTLEKLNPELVGKKLTAGAQVRLKADETKEMMQAAAPVSSEGIYTIKNGGQLKHVAMRTGIPVETLEKLNPELKGKRLTAGAQVKLI